MEVNIEVQDLGESIQEAIIAKWIKKTGEYVEMDEVVAELESDKANVPLVAQKAGQLKIMKEEDETVSVGEVIGKIDTSAQKTVAVKEDPSPKKDEAKAEDKSNNYAKGHPSPAAKKMASENNIDLKEISGTGKDQRITKEDVRGHVAKKATASVSQKTSQETAGTSSSRSIEKKKMTPLRKTIAQRLVQSQQTAALLTTFNEVDMYPVSQLRKKYKQEFFVKHNIGLGYMSFFTKAVCKALMEFPVINAGVDGDHIIYHNYCDIGIAVATPKGLVVPVIRSAEQMSFAQIESSIKEYAKRGQEGRLSMRDMTGGTFTITNGGVFGSMLSTPIINPPQSAILGMHNIVERPVAINGEVVIRPVMFVALSYDHRIIDGSESVRFLVKIKKMIEEPERLLLDL